MIPSMTLVSLLLGQADAAAVTRELIRIEQQLADTWKAGDCDGWGRLVASDWSVIHVTGDVLSRQDALALCRTPPAPILTFEIADLAVRVFGDTAVVTGRTTVSVGGATPATVHLRFTDVFVRQPAGWRAVASHATRLGQ